MNVLSMPTIASLLLAYGVLHVQGALLRQQAQIHLSNVSNISSLFRARAIDENEVVVAFGASEQDEQCVAAGSPVTCASDSGNYGKRVNAELQPNKDPAPDEYEVTVKDDDATNVCVKRVDDHENPGWGQDLQITCAKNVCTCENGKVIDDPHCTASAEMCVECSPGFSLVEGACHQNTCTCANGSPQVEAWCTTDQGESCKECNQGFHQDGEACQANTCKCDNGIPQTDNWCSNDGAELCKDCNGGFHKDGDRCVQDPTF